MIKLIAFLFTILNLTLISPVYGQQKISDEDNTFNFIIPNDWEEIPLDEINQEFEAIKKLRKGNRKKVEPINLMGFKLKGERADWYPHVQIREVYSPITEQDIKDLEKVDWQWIKKRLNEIQENMAKHETPPYMFYDKEKGFMWILMRMLNKTGFEDYYILMVGAAVPTKKGHLMVTCTLKEENKKKYYTTCFKKIKSFNVSDDFIIRYK